MLQRGDTVPHFAVTVIDGRPFSYSTIWQHRSLVLVTLPNSDPDAGYASELSAAAPGFTARGAECVITRDPVPGLPAPGVLVADRWGEIAHVETAAGVAELPPAGELLDWVEHLQERCPECEGEAR